MEINVQEVNLVMSLQAINQEDTETVFTVLDLAANYFVIFAITKRFKFLGHPVFLARHKEGFCIQITSSCIMP
jgi:hypothetical protein